MFLQNLNLILVDWSGASWLWCSSQHLGGFGLSLLSLNSARCCVQWVSQNLWWDRFGFGDPPKGLMWAKPNFHLQLCNQIFNIFPLNPPCNVLVHVLRQWLGVRSGAKQVHMEPADFWLTDNAHTVRPHECSLTLSIGVSFFSPPEKYVSASHCPQLRHFISYCLGQKAELWKFQGTSLILLAKGSCSWVCLTILSVVFVINSIQPNHTYQKPTRGMTLCSLLFIPRDRACAIWELMS